MRRRRRDEPTPRLVSLLTADHLDQCRRMRRSLRTWMAWSTAAFSLRRAKVGSAGILLDIEEKTSEAIEALLRTARCFKEDRDQEWSQILRGKVVCNLFFEDSTRTRTSFSLAARKLGANVVEFTSRGSSMSKGESFVDTARNLEALGADAVVVRHHTPGTPHLLTKHLRACVINAGDGAHEHPTQGLLDILTILDVKKKVEGLRVCLVGDIMHSRVARSNIWGLRKLGARVVVCGPKTLIQDRSRSSVSKSATISTKSSPSAT